MLIDTWERSAYTNEIKNLTEEPKYDASSSTLAKVSIDYSSLDIDKYNIANRSSEAMQKSLLLDNRH